jgi:hypothetical protein
MKEFVDHISSLKPATIRDYVNTVKAVVASARDRKGEPLFMRDWDYGFIDAPEVDEQNQPTVDQDEMEMILREAEEPYCTLYALLAGCGPMRAGEALGLDIRSPWRLPNFGDCAESQARKASGPHENEERGFQTRAGGGSVRAPGRDVA